MLRPPDTVHQYEFRSARVPFVNVATRGIGWRIAVAIGAALAILLSLLSAPKASADAPLPTLTLKSGALLSSTKFTVGETVTISSAGWSPAAASVQYQWYRNHEVVSGATSASYTFTQDDQ